MANSKIENVGFHHIALMANDYEKSLKFYSEGLGFKPVASWGEETGRITLLDIGNGSHFEIFAKGAKEEPANERFVHFAFSTTDPDSAFDNAMAAGAVAHIEPKDVILQSDPPLNVRIAFVKGPDGELLEFFKTY